MSYINNSSDWGFKEIKTQKNKTFGFSDGHRYGVEFDMYALCGALLRLLDLALNQKVTTFGAQTFKKKMPKPPQNTSVSSLFISFSLSVGDSLHLFCPVLSYYLYLIFVSAFFFLCWFYETALLTRQRSQCFATNEFLFLFRPRSVLCSVLTCSHSTQCCVLLWWDKLSVYHKNVCHFVPRGKMLRCEMIPGRVKKTNN